MGRPLVAARVGGLPEIVRDGETGLLVPPEDPATLAAAIRRLQGDPAFAARIGAAARRHTTEHFSMDRCAADYSALYARLLRARAPSA
jgi:glycosyltransferase involved in cell wall biosynthesis